jgi:uncharacterized protein
LLGAMLCAIFIAVLPLLGLSAEIRKIPVTFVDISGRELCRIEAEPAVTPHELARGLMFRPYLPPRYGMLFIHDRDEVQHYWMKNVVIGLDMIFINGKNEVVHIHPDAEPHDETAISSRYPARYVLEINAGEAKECRIRRGVKAAFGR